MVNGCLFVVNNPVLIRYIQMSGQNNVFYEDATLIDLVKKNAFIFNNSDVRFKDKLERKKAWQRIGAVLNITEHECETRFGTIRNRFATERRILKSRESENRPVESDWPLYNAMKFLDPFVRPRRNPYRVLQKHEKRKICSVAAEMPLQDPLLTSCDLPKTQFIFRATAQSPINQTDHEYNTNTLEPATVDLPDQVRFVPEVNTKYVMDNNNDTSELMSRLQKVEESIKQEKKRKVVPTSNDDQFQSFGRTIAFMLSSIKNKKRQRKAMADLLKKISEYDTDTDSE